MYGHILNRQISMEMQCSIKLEEAGTIINNIKNDKSPQNDFFNVNFFKLVWKGFIAVSK